MYEFIIFNYYIMGKKKFTDKIQHDSLVHHKFNGGI